METGQAVALKHVTKTLQQRGRNGVDAKQMWSRELRAMQDLSHPNIVRLLDAIPQVRLPMTLYFASSAWCCVQCVIRERTFFLTG